MTVLTVEQKQRRSETIRRRRELAAELRREIETATDVMWFFRPSAGDIGEPLKHIELEPVEVPSVVPVTVPEREEVPA